MCHLAAIIELLFLLDSISVSFILKEPNAHNGGDRGSVASVQMTYAHEFTHPFVSDTAGTMHM